MLHGIRHEVTNGLQILLFELGTRLLVYKLFVLVLWKVLSHDILLEPHIMLNCSKSKVKLSS
jgi:hypothetical protein